MHHDQPIERLLEGVRDSGARSSEFWLIAAYSSDQGARRLQLLAAAMERIRSRRLERVRLLGAAK